MAALEGDGSSLLLEPADTSPVDGVACEGERDAVTDDDEALRTDSLLRGASMVVGMHSDGEPW